MNRPLVLMLVGVFTFLTACSSGNRNTVPVSPEPSVVDDQGSGAETGGIGEGEDSVGILDEELGPDLSKDTVYFAFDQSNVKPEYMDIVENYVQFLQANPNNRVRLEGHADERGSREYNIGLGERRAQAVRNIMRLRGIPDSQISTVSYGEERPLDSGHDELAWQANRRVQLVRN